MQRFPRLGSINLGLMVMALTFHLLAISYNRWRVTTCKECTSTDVYRVWTTSLTERCYHSSVSKVLFPETNLSKLAVDPFYTDICIPNQYLFPYKPIFAPQCLQAMQNGPHTVCAAGLYDGDVCECDYSDYTKAIIALAVLSSVILGCMLVVSHFTSYIHDASVLKWLLPSGFISLIFALICMFSILVLTGSQKYDDAELIVSWTLINASNATITNVFFDPALLRRLSLQYYDVEVSWCFGFEIIAAYFTLIGALVYILMFLAKKRPNPEGEEEEEQ